tara:strand:+ start:2972 stop:3985 length:1014 start_codon:yes stop_codon:yes gene_type:complete
MSQLNIILDKLLYSTFSNVLGEVNSRGLQQFSSLLPSGFSSYYVELRSLNKKFSDRVDLLCSINHQSPPPSNWLNSTDTQTLKEHLKSTYNNLSKTQFFTPFVWLEFDDIVARIPNQISSPGTHFCLESGYPNSLQKKRELNLYEPYQFAQSLCIAQLGHRLNSLEKIYSYLPQDAHIIHLSFMLGRAPATTKLYVCMSRADIIEYLKNIKWSGQISAIQDALQLWQSIEVSEYLFFDITICNDEIQDSFALVTSPVKYSANNNNFEFTAEKNTSTKKIINKLYQLEYVSTEHHKSLSHWIGEEPPHISSWMDFKLVIDNNKPEYFKAYLGIQPKVL